MNRRLIARLFLAAAALSIVPLSGCATGPADSGALDCEDEKEDGALSPADEPEQTTEDAQSTFAIDIDTASYDYAARTLEEGEWPVAEEVRPEEFANAFGQDYPVPEGDGIAAGADGTVAPDWYGKGDERILRVGLQTAPEPAGERADAALTFVIDISGSMSGPGRLDLVKDSLDHLIDQLRPTDKVAIVVYSDTAQVLREMTPVSEREDLHAAVAELCTKESTNLEDGLVTGYEVARRGFTEGASNRVILLSDGLANTGATEAEPILEQVRGKAGEGIALLCVGVGEEYGDVLMEQLADNGDGFAVYVSETEQARELFVTRLPSTLAVRARDTKVQVTFDEQVVESYRLIGFENRAIADEEFTDDSVDGGEVGPGHSVTALFEVTLADGAGGDAAAVDVRWLDPATGEPGRTSVPVASSELDTTWPDASPRLRVALTAAAFAEALRDDAGRETFAALRAEAEDLATSTEDPDVVRLATLIGIAEEMR